MINIFTNLGDWNFWGGEIHNAQVLLLFLLIEIYGFNNVELRLKYNNKGGEGEVGFNI